MEVQFKTWLNTDDPRTRPTHVRAGDQRVQMDETFIVGGARLRFPHDPLGPPGETINCRCTLLFDEQPLCVCSPGWVRNELKTVTAAGQPDCGCSEPLPQLQTETDPKLPEPTKDHEAEEEEKRREAEFDILGLLTFPVRHSPTTGRFVPGRGGGGGRSKKPPQIVRKRGDDPNAPERAKAAKTRQRAIARAKAKQKPGDFGEGANFDQEKAKEFGEEGFKEWRGNLTSSQRSSIKAYTDSGFAKGINDRLRGVPLDSENAGRVKTIDKHIGNIRAAFDAPGARTPAAVTAHRVMSGPLAERIISEHRNGRLLTSAGGAKFRDSGIVSTSLDRSIATKSSASQNKRVTLEIDVPKGQKAVYPGSLSRFPIESELLLPPGTAFEVTGAGNRGGVLNLKVRIIDSL